MALPGVPPQLGTNPDPADFPDFRDQPIFIHEDFAGGCLPFDLLLQGQPVSLI